MISPTWVAATVRGPEANELGTLFRIGLAVQQVVRESKGSPHRADVVAMGADGTPTEELDRRAEAEILRTMDAEGVDWNLISEEIGHVERGGSKTLVADPIDGTSNAIRHLPFSTVSLALGRRDLAGIDIGLVRDLSRGRTFWGVRGEGAFLDGHRIRTRRWKPRTEVAFLNLGSQSTERAVRLGGRARRVRSLGCASLEIAMVAQGGGDVYLFENVDPGRNLRATDIAASYRILLEAGGGMTDSAGGPLESFPLGVERRTSVLAWGDPELGKAFAGGGLP
jgi:NAD+ kinase